jgi:hypothetical protein
MSTTMAATESKPGSKPSADSVRKIQELRELFADAPEILKYQLTAEGGTSPVPI